MCAEALIEVQIENKSRLACPRDKCDYVFWDNPIPVVAAIIEHDGGVILARNKAWPPKMFGVITGFLEKGETCEEGVLREVKEELGLVTRDLDFIGVYSFNEQNQLILAYHIVAEGSIELGEELAEIKHVPTDKLRPWPFGTGLALRDWLETKQEKG
jgi:NADH pyrophosphatase NudC (nudix superfamily)